MEATVMFSGVPCIKRAESEAIKRDKLSKTVTWVAAAAIAACKGVEAEGREEVMVSLTKLRLAWAWFG